MSVTATEVGIVTADADTLSDFFLALGFVREHRFDFPQGIVVRLRAGDARVKLFQPAEPPGSPAPPEPWHRDAGFAYAALHVSAIDDVVASAAAAGATVRTPVTNHRPGAWFALLTDPDGNVWEVLEER